MQEQQCRTVQDTVNEQVGKSFLIFSKKRNWIAKTKTTYHTILAQVCNTVQEQQCSTVNEEQCSTVNEQVCSPIHIFMTAFSFVGHQSELYEKLCELRMALSGLQHCQRAAVQHGQRAGIFQYHHWSEYVSSFLTGFSLFHSFQNQFQQKNLSRCATQFRSRSARLSTWRSMKSSALLSTSRSTIRPNPLYSSSKRKWVHPFQQQFE